MLIKKTLALKTEILANRYEMQPIHPYPAIFSDRGVIPWSDFKRLFTAGIHYQHIPLQPLLHWSRLPGGVESAPYSISMSYL
jgi:hypothetical protein